MKDVGGMAFEDAWVVTEGWVKTAKMIFPTKESAEAYLSMAKVPQGEVMPLARYHDRIKNNTKRDVISRLDRDWAHTRNSVIWED